MGGLVNLLFYYAIESVKQVVLRHPGDPVEVAEMIGYWDRVAIPTLGGLAAGLVLHWGLRLVGPQGSANLLEVIIAGDGRLPLRGAIVKFVSSLMTIGTGGSIGREGGIVQLSATFASKWGQLAKWHPYRLRLLVGCGAASGISAAYNAPISGAVFAALIVLGNFSMNLFAPLVFASVVATMVSRSFFGIRPWYTVPPFEFTRITQLPWFLCLGVLAGAMGAAFLKLLNATENAFKKIRGPIFIRLGLGGLIVGVIALQFPGVWGNGYVVTNRILHGEYGSPLLLPNEIVQPQYLALKLKHPSDSDILSRDIAAQLSPATKSILSNYDGSVNGDFQKAIADDLNRIIASGPLFETQRFASVALSTETASLLAQKPEGGDLVRLNRKLLLEAYPQEISTD